MNLIIEKSRSISHFLHKLLNHTQKKADHKTLSRHIIKLNQKKAPINIIRQSASCLKEITRYQLFAFAIETNQELKAWMDPIINEDMLKNMIRRDFNLPDNQMVKLERIHKKSNDPGILTHEGKLVSYVMHQPNFKAKIYMIPGKTIYAHHDEIAQLVLKSTSVALSRQMEIQNLSNAATIDPLTGCYNRREFENQLKKNTSKANRHNTDVSIFMFDLDHFKQVNDQYGHPAGDAVLKTVSSLVCDNMRKGDILARYGGEEFVAILPRTDKNKAIELAERLRIKIMNQKIKYEDKSIRVTASFGVVQMKSGDTDINRFIKTADDLLYKAKLKGRNTVMPGLMKIIPTPSHTFTSQSIIL